MSFYGSTAGNDEESAASEREPLVMPLSPPQAAPSAAARDGTFVGSVKRLLGNAKAYLWDQFEPNIDFQHKLNVGSFVWLLVLTACILLGAMHASGAAVTALEQRVMVLETHVRQLTTAQITLQHSFMADSAAMHVRMDKSEFIVQRLSSNTTTNLDLQEDISDLRGSIKGTLDTFQQHVDMQLGQSEARVSQTKKALNAEMRTMRQSFNATRAQMAEAVDGATGLIHDEVQDVKDTMDAYVAVTNHQFAAENDFVKYQLAGTFTLIGCLISFWHLTGHLRNLHKPDVQRRILAILWMVPIYSVSSWLSMVLPVLEPLLTLIRDCYEAYAIHTFVAFLIAILEDGMGLHALVLKLTEQVEAEMEAGTLTTKPPLGCCYDPTSPSSIAVNWLYQCKLLTLQFVVLKPIMAVAPMLFRLMGHDTSMAFVDENGYPHMTNPMLYLGILETVAVGLAFVGLLSFYHGAEKEIGWCNPWPKFLCIKGVVFATFWQGVLLQSMAVVELIDAKSAAQIQNLLICIEMLIAAVAHFYIFPHEEWHDGFRRRKQASSLLKDSLALKDFVTDMKQAVTAWDVPVTPGPGKVRPTGAGAGAGGAGAGQDEGSPLLPVGEGGSHSSGGVTSSNSSTPLPEHVRSAIKSVVDVFEDIEDMQDMEDSSVSVMSGTVSVSGHAGGHVSSHVSAHATPERGSGGRQRSSSDLERSRAAAAAADRTMGTDYGSFSGLGSTLGILPSPSPPQSASRSHSPTDAASSAADAARRSSVSQVNNALTRLHGLRNLPLTSMSAGVGAGPGPGPRGFSVHIPAPTAPTAAAVTAVPLPPTFLVAASADAPPMAPIPISPVTKGPSGGESVLGLDGMEAPSPVRAATPLDMEETIEFNSFIHDAEEEVGTSTTSLGSGGGAEEREGQERDEAVAGVAGREEKAEGGDLEVTDDAVMVSF